MIIPALVLSLLAQGVAEKPDYSVPVGASSEFHHLVIDIEKALTAKDYARAEKLAGLLPHTPITYRIDTSKLSESQRDEFQESVRAAAVSWEQVLTRQVTFRAVTGDTPDILFSFEPVLAKLPGTEEVAGATWFLATEPTPPLIEAVIGLKRGPKFQKVLGREVFNESVFTFGRYLGLAPSPLVGSGMGRIEGQMGNPSSIVSQEVVAAKKILNLSSLLRTAIHKKEAIEVGHPAVNVEKTTLEFEPQLQGDEGRAQMLITNNGTAPLELSVRGDCGCIGGVVAPILDPGKSTLLTGVFDTKELVGDVHHNLILRTNDPDVPTVTIPVSITVTPRAEAVFPESNTAYMDGNEQTFTFYIHSAEQKVFRVIESAISDNKLTVAIEPFDGETANFLKPGQKQMIHGYKVTVNMAKYPKEALFGRAMGMLYMRTDNPKISVVKFPFYVQKGIVGLPETIYLGSPKGASDSHFLLTRPGRPFTIKKISSESKYLTFTVTKNEKFHDAEYSIKVLYDGKAPGHILKSVIVVETDDPKQPVIRIPIQTSGV